MRQFKINFTRDTLSKHLTYNLTSIVAVTNASDVMIGDCTIINSEIYILTDKYQISLGDLISTNNMVWAVAGFESRKEYFSEVEHIYGSNLNTQLFVITLNRVRFV